MNLTKMEIETIREAAYELINLDGTQEMGGKLFAILKRLGASEFQGGVR